MPGSCATSTARKLISSRTRAILARSGTISRLRGVVGAIHYAGAPQTVSWLARSMGLTRQGVQRIVNELEGEGIVAFKANPAHRRAHLVTLTRKGQAAYAAAERRQTPWINALAKGLDRAELERTLRLLGEIRERLESAQGNEERL